MPPVTVASSTSSLAILSNGHQLCQTCTEILKSKCLRPSSKYYRPYHQDLAALLEAAKLPCYICAQFYSAIMPRCEIQYPPGYRVGCEDDNLDIFNRISYLPSMQFGVKESIRKDTKLLTDPDMDLEAHLKFPKNTGHPTVLQYAVDWLNTCLKEHNCFKKSLAVPWHPTRLLDVNDLRLVLTSDEPVSGAYATLSYRWGDKPSFFTLTAKNIDQLRVSITPELLPKVFRDAIGVSRHLGIRYLWIDALCIIQSGKGSGEDWAVEGAKMRYVYSYCQVNISASCANQPEDGFFVTRDASLLEPLRVQTGDMVMKVEHKYRLSSELTNSPLAERAWILQERVLSPRILNFGRQQLFWECYELAVAEDTRLQGGWTHAIESVPFSLDPPYEPDSQTRFGQWNRIVKNYSRRSLTCPHKDKFIAIAAIAEEMGRKYEDEYIAGFFRKQLPQILMWSLCSTVARPKCRAKPYRAPSWSWASIDAEINLTVISGGKVAGLFDVIVDLVDTTNKFGQIRSASIVLRGLAGHINSTDFLMENSLDRALDGGLNIEFDTLADEALPLKDLTIFLIQSPTGANVWQPGFLMAEVTNPLYFLVLKTVEGEVFVRVGTLTVMVSKFEEKVLLQNLTLVIITIE